MRSTSSAIEPLESRIAPATVFAVTTSNQLVSFDAYVPETFLTTSPISGLQNGETIEGIDFRPADGGLFALGSSSRLYTLNLTTGAATQVGNGTFAIPLNGTHFGFDFNPTNDRIRVLSDTNQNFRLNPVNGNVVDGDLDTAGIQPDGTPGGVLDASGAAYTNNFAGATTTTLFIIDTASDELKILGGLNGMPPPTSGTVTSFGAKLGVSAANSVVFDIGRVFGVETALAGVEVLGVTSLYNINLANGHANLIGKIGTGTALNGMAISPSETAGSVTINSNGSRSATYTDLDGDLVTVSVSKGTLTQAMFSLRKEGPNNGAILQKLDLALDPQIAGANVTISAKPTDFGGDGQVNIGYINATGLDLGNVKIAGDLARIDAGGGADNKKSIASLDVLSMGTLGTSTQSITVAATPGALASNLLGGVSKINVRGSVVGASITVSGGLDAAVGSVTILGDLVGGDGLFSGSIRSLESDIKSIKISGSVFGSGGAGSGYVFASRELGSATVLGSLFGGSGAYSGSFEGATLVNGTISGDMRGGDGGFSGSLNYFWISKKVTVKGSLFGGLLESSGSILAIKDPVPDVANQIDGTIGNVTVNGGLIGGAGKFSGSIRAQTLLKSATVDGSLNGAFGEKSGSIYSDQTLTLAKVGGNVVGGTGLLSGSIAGENSDDGGAITKSISIDGSLYSTVPNSLTGIVLQGKTSKVTIGGGVVGLNGSTVTMRFTGYPFTSPPPENSADANAIGTIKIGGDVRNADIITGFDGAGPSRGDANIKSITVGGSVLATNIVAAINPGADEIWGTGDDSLFSPRGSGLIPTIGSITIKGQLLGTPGGVDGFVITAGLLKSIKIGSVGIPLDSKNIDRISSYGAGRDITIFEVPENS